MMWRGGEGRSHRILNPSGDMLVRELLLDIVGYSRRLFGLVTLSHRGRLDEKNGRDADPSSNLISPGLISGRPVRVVK
jgi:hypothetical protein